MYTGLNSVIGNPTDYSNNKQNNGFDRRVELRIPTHETDQKKPARVGTDNMIMGRLEEVEEPISNSLNTGFNSLQIRQPSNQQQQPQRSPAP